MSFTSIFQKAQESSFRQRLTVAIIEQCRWVLQSGQPAALQDLARRLRARTAQSDWLTRTGIYVLLPWGSIDPDDDNALQTRVAEVFEQLGDQALPDE